MDSPISSEMSVGDFPSVFYRFLKCPSSRFIPIPGVLKGEDLCHRLGPILFVKQNVVVGIGFERGIG